MEAGVLQAGCSQPFGVGGPARTAECARRTEAHIIEQDDEHIGGASRRTQRPDRREPGIRIFCIVRGETDWLAVRNRQYLTWDIIATVHRSLRVLLRAVGSVVAECEDRGTVVRRS